MRVAAEFEHFEDAMAAHRLLIDEGLEAEDVEIRSPYPLPEMPLAPHRERPFVMRTIVRLMWAQAVIFGWSFLAYTQLDWNLRTDGHPIVSVPTNCLIMYEIGMITGILTTTFMFLWETRFFRKLVPPLEEDLPVAHGHVVLVIDGKSADRAHTLLQNRGARSLVTYGLVLLLGLFATGCGTFDHFSSDHQILPKGTWPYNTREQAVNKPGEGLPPFTNHKAELGEVAAPDTSLVMPNPGGGVAPPPFQHLTPGDPTMTFTDVAPLMRGLDPAAPDYADKLYAYRSQVPAWLQIKALVQSTAALGKPEFLTQGRDPNDQVDLRMRQEIDALLKVQSFPESTAAGANERGKVLFENNCAFCHGTRGQGDGPVGKSTQPNAPKIGDGQIYGHRPDSPYTDGYFYLMIMVGKNNMPPFVNKLSPQEIHDIIAHLRVLQTGGQ